METFTIDSSILWGATLPIFFITLASSILRQYVAFILGSGSQAQQNSNVEESINQSYLFRAKALHANGALLPLRSFVTRRAYFTRPGSGVLCESKPAPNPFQNFLAQQGDPTAMMGALKKQVFLLFLSGGIGYLINYFFSGFLVAKAPFPLPYKFKSMLQRGVDVPDSDPTFVSSLSWYFFVLISSSHFFALLNHLSGDDALFQQALAGDSKAAFDGLPSGTPMDSFTGGGASPFPGLISTDFNKLFLAEKQALDTLTHVEMLNTVCSRVTQQFNDHQE